MIHCSPPLVWHICGTANILRSACTSIGCRPYLPDRIHTPVNPFCTFGSAGSIPMLSQANWAAWRLASMIRSARCCSGSALAGAPARCR